MNLLNIKIHEGNLDLSKFIVFTSLAKTKAIIIFPPKEEITNKNVLEVINGIRQVST